MEELLCKAHLTGSTAPPSSILFAPASPSPTHNVSPFFCLGRSRSNPAPWSSSSSRGAAPPSPEWHCTSSCHNGAIPLGEPSPRAYLSPFVCDVTKLTPSFFPRSTPEHLIHFATGCHHRTASESSELRPSAATLLGLQGGHVVRWRSSRCGPSHCISARESPVIAPRWRIAREPPASGATVHAPTSLQRAALGSMLGRLGSSWAAQC
jgi:hypothetical protein